MERITDPRDVGQFFKDRIKKRGLLIKDVAERVGADPSYMSHMLSGRVNIVDSDYFNALVRELNLSLEEVRAISPDAVVTVAAPEEEKPGRRGPPVPPIIPFRETPITIPRELLEMVEKHGDAYPVLKTEQMQRMLAAPRNFGGAEVGPQTAEDWFDYWMANKRFLT